MIKPLKFLRLLKSYGFINTFFWIRNRMFLWRLKIKATDLTKGTSASDSAEFAGYLAICDAASKTHKYFKKFRSNSDYKKVLDHVDYLQAMDYYSRILKKDLDLKKLKRFIKSFDSIGHPDLFYFPKLGLCSPTSLRYIKVSMDLNDLFGTLDEFVVTEIGVGFGGQGVTLCQNNSVKQYQLWDIDQVLLLSKKFIHFMDPKLLKIFNFNNGREPQTQISDLVISNYAFSELNRDLQTKYLETIIRNARRGYITWNSISFDQRNGYALQELLDLIPGSRAIEEFPLTATGNRIIVWG